MRAEEKEKLKEVVELIAYVHEHHPLDRTEEALKILRELLA